MTALTTVQAYQRELDKLLSIDIDRLTEQLSNGYVESIEEYRNLTGKIAGLRSARDLMQEADRVCAELYR